MNYKVIADSFKNRKSIRNKVMFTAFAVGLSLSASVLAQVPSYVPTNGLDGWWSFNGNANDESGNGNNGTVNGATQTADRNGNINAAYFFNGTASYISLASSFFNGSTSVSSFSYFAEFKINQLPVTGTAYSISTKEGFWRALGLYVYDNGSLSFGGSQPNPQGYISVIAPANSINPNQWYCVVVTFQNSILSLYIDGQLISTSTINYADFDFSWVESGNSTSTNYLGAAHPVSPGITNYFNGVLDNFGTWNRVLSQAELNSLCQNCQLNITTQPTSQTININTNTQFILGSSSQNASYQWQSNPSNIGWVNLSDNANYTGVNNDTLLLSNVQLANHNQPFRVIASNGNCVDTSNIATIQIADTCITNVTVYDTLFTTVTDTLIINTTLSLPAPNNENTILIYPNPASDHITIDNGNFAAMAGYSIKIENNAGQQVFQSAINQAQFYVDLSSWTGNGLYFVHLIDPQNNTVTVRKIVLQ